MKNLNNLLVKWHTSVKKHAPKPGSGLTYVLASGEPDMIRNEGGVRFLVVEPDADIAKKRARLASDPFLFEKLPNTANMRAIRRYMDANMRAIRRYMDANKRQVKEQASFKMGGLHQGGTRDAGARDAGARLSASQARLVGGTLRDVVSALDRQAEQTEPGDASGAELNGLFKLALRLRDCAEIINPTGAPAKGDPPSIKDWASELSDLITQAKASVNPERKDILHALEAARPGSYEGRARLLSTRIEYAVNALRDHDHLSGLRGDLWIARNAAQHRENGTTPLS